MSVFDRIRGAALRDPHGQPTNAGVRRAFVADRDIDELVGIVKGVVADGSVVAAEARFLLGWLEQHANVRHEWPACVLYPRLAAALEDGHLSEAEEGELLGLLAQTAGGNAPARGEKSMSTTLPFDHPAPAVEFSGYAFCFTGKFYAGTRDWCEGQVRARGGSIAGISKQLRYLVIGEVGSRDWIHSTHGRKIEKAVELRKAGAPLLIVAEQHWHSYL